MTHASGDVLSQGETVECERATIAFQPYAHTDDGADCQHVTIRYTDGRVEEQRDASLGNVEGFLAAQFRAYGDCVAGRAERPLTRLEDCRPFVALNDLAYIAAGRIVTVPEEYVVRRAGDASAGGVGSIGTSDGPSGFAAITGVEEAVEEFLASGRMPSEQHAPWAVPGGRATMADIPRLRAVVTAMRDASGRGDVRP